MSGIDMGLSTGTGIAEIGRAFTEEIGRKRKESWLKELEEREKLAAEFDKLSNDQALDPADRQQAAMHARAVRLLMPEKKRPKEYLPDQKLAEQTGSIGIPAMVPLLFKKVAKEGPKQPAEPSAPSSVAASSIPPMPEPPALPAGVTFGAPPELSMPAMPPMPGGDQQGPNAISPAPAVAAVGGTPGPPAAPAAGGVPPMPEQFSYEPKFRSPEEIAAETARLKSIESQVPLDVDPATGMADARALPYLRGQQTAAIQMRKLGLNPDGTPIPIEQMTPAERVKIERIQSQIALADAQEELARANAEGVPQKIQIAREALSIAAQRAATAEKKAAADLMLMGAMTGGAGGVQSLLGQPDMGINDPIDAMVEMTLTGQAPITNWPSKVRPMIALKIAQRGGVVVPDKLQDKLMHFTEAREAVDTIYDSIENYIKTDGANKVWAGYQMKSKVDGLTRVVGRALGEKGVFTDRDKADFQKLLSPGMILTLTAPERAQAWVKEVEALMERVEQKQLQGFYQRVYARKSGELDTFKPGDQKNVVRELGAVGGPGLKPKVAPMPASEPAGELVVGKSKKVINGREMIYAGKVNGKDAWKPVKK